MFSGGHILKGGRRLITKISGFVNSFCRHILLQLEIHIALDRQSNKKVTDHSVTLSRTCLRNNERTTQLSVLETEVRDSDCNSIDQYSKDLKPN